MGAIGDTDGLVSVILTGPVIKRKFTKTKHLSIFAKNKSNNVVRNRDIHSFFDE